MRTWTSAAAAGLLLLLLADHDAVSAFSLPGVQMTTYQKSEHLPLFVNSLTSAETLLPLDYYKLPFCQVRTYRIAGLMCMCVYLYVYDCMLLSLHVCVYVRDDGGLPELQMPFSLVTRMENKC